MINFKKEMIYTIKMKREVLATGTYKGYDWYILSMGAYPCAYINLGKTRISKENYDFMPVHGGITYHEDYLYLEDETIKGNIIGWDYSHYDDYSGWLAEFMSDIDTSGLKRWTTDEIIEDVKFGIEWILIFKGGDENG